MNHALKLAIASAVLVLAGQGCPARPSPALELPAEPPGSRGDTQKSATGSMMEKEQQGEATKSATGAEMQKEGEDVREEAMEKPSALKPYYVSYSAEAAAQARAEGRPVVYYFWAAWCPICRADEPVIVARIEKSGLPVAGFRVNYDTEPALKTKYKIPYQHTTVFLDAEGVEVARLNGPVGDAEFAANLALAAK